MKQILAAALSLCSLSQAAPVADQCGYWPGWSNIKNLVTFGDSYSQTGFESPKTQPSPGNPMGNPPYPGWTSANGPNWVGLLTTKYNASALLSYNIAFGGATVDAKLAKPWMDNVHSLIDQVEKDFLPVYGPGGKYNSKWNSADTLFGIWEGVNDVMSTHGSNNETLVNEIMSRYSGLLDKLYKGGAKNFVLLDAPALQYTPQQQKWPDSLPVLAKAVKTWAAKIETMASDLRKKYPDVTVLTFSTDKVFENIVKDPKTYSQTASLKVVGSEYCDAYQNGNAKGNQKAASCKATPDEYFWLNAMHPTTTVHEAVAAELSKYLKTVPAAKKCKAR